MEFEKVKIRITSEGTFLNKLTNVNEARVVNFIIKNSDKQNQFDLSFEYLENLRESVNETKTRTNIHLTTLINSQIIINGTTNRYQLNPKYFGNKDYV